MKNMPLYRRSVFLVYVITAASVLHGETKKITTAQQAKKKVMAAKKMYVARDAIPELHTFIFATSLSHFKTCLLFNSQQPYYFHRLYTPLH